MQLMRVCVIVTCREDLELAMNPTGLHANANCVVQVGKQVWSGSPSDTGLITYSLSEITKQMLYVKVISSYHQAL